MIEEYTYSAENLLHHFTAILHANNGFKVAMRDLHEVRDREGLDEPAVKYMAEILDMLTKSGLCPRTTPSFANLIWLTRILGAHLKYHGPTFGGDDLPAPDGRWIMRLFDGVSR